MSLYSLDSILQVLPHRHPFVFVDRVIKLLPDKQIVAERDLRPDEPHFAGHFPGRPLMPGVLVTEALAQTSGLLIAFSLIQKGAPPPESPPIFYLAAAQMKFTHPASPGDTLTLKAEGGPQFGQLHRFQVEATAGRHLVATGTLTLAEAAVPGSPPDVAH